jgi:hypothetical protein
MEAQVQADGSHFEQSTYYHVYALDMLLFSTVLEEMPPDYSASLGRMADYLDALLGPQRRLAFLGDDDGGRLFHPYGARDCFGRASLAAMARGPANDYAEMGAWWFGEQSHDRRGVVVPLSRSRLFEDAGIAIMQAGDTQLIADAGPMGSGGAGHSHADALSFVLRRGDEELLVDAGTFTYVGDARWRAPSELLRALGRTGPLPYGGIARWRDWFRGTAAHNTMRIDGLDQATPVDPFRWADKPDVAINAWRSNSEEDYLDASCRYRGLEHRRRIRFDKPNTISVVDEVTGSGGPHLLEQFWHSGEEVTEESPRNFRLGQGARLFLSHDATLQIGGADGWRSRVFGSKEPAAVICMAWKQELPASFLTVIELSAR